ncbi:tape measure protein [Peptostreptococcus sp. D1]|uniref:tape measure protein n=1 Tax=Peptostreptococcus sp. D1 TaxID=72304 RepID=UPI0015A693AF|nr:tape measure protein [Peptostreptococcus sp. D1]
MQAELRKFKKETKEIEKANKEFDKSLKGNKKLKVDGKDAKKQVDEVSKKYKSFGDMIKKSNKIPIEVKDLASKGLDAIGGKLNKLGPLGSIPLKLLGKHPVLAGIGLISLGIGKLAKSAYNDIKVKLNDMTQWGIQKIQQGLNSLKDKVIKVTIDGYNNYSDYKARASSLDRGGMSIGGYDSLVQGVARNSRSNLSDVRNGMTKLMQMSPDVFGGKPQEAAKFYQTAMQSFRKGGSSGEEASSAMYQLNQGLASGTLQGDELRTIRESAPLMAKMIEKEVGMGIKEAGKEGLLTADLVKRAILKNSEQVNKEFQNIPMNFKDAWVIANNLLESKVYTPMYERMQKIFDSQIVKDFFSGLFTDAEKAIDGLWKLLDITNFGGIDFSKLKTAAKPITDMLDDVYNHIITNSPEAQEAINMFGQQVNGAFEGMGDVFQFFKGVAEDVFKFLKENPDFIKNAIKLLASDWEKKWQLMQVKLKLADKVILPLLTGINNAISGIVGALKDVMQWWDKTINHMRNTNFEGLNGLDGFQTGSSSGGIGVDNSGVPSYARRAMGQSRIPYDNYPIRAHQGEKLLTKREANEYENRDQERIVININDITVREEADIDLLVSRLVKRMKLAKAGGV